MRTPSGPQLAASPRGPPTWGGSVSPQARDSAGPCVEASAAQNSPGRAKPLLWGHLPSDMEEALTFPELRCGTPTPRLSPVNHTVHISLPQPG